MESNLRVLQTCPLFDGIAPADYEKALDCLGSIQRSFAVGETILALGSAPKAVGILLSGSATIASYDAAGHRNVLAKLEPGELFGESYTLAAVEQLPVEVIGNEAAEALFIDFQALLSDILTACPFHGILIGNMLSIVARKNVQLNERQAILAKRRMRDKILTFLAGYMVRQKSNAVAIPFNRDELADFLCVDRSALSAELSRMRDEGWIQFRKNHFTVLTDNISSII